MSLTEVLTEREIKFESEVSKRILSYSCSCRLLCESFFYGLYNTIVMLELEIQKISACSFLSNVLPLSLVRLPIYNKTSEANRLFCLTFAVCFVQQNLAQTNVFGCNLYVFVLFDVFQRLFQREDHRRGNGYLFI